MAAAGILNQTSATGQPLAGTQISPMASSSSDGNNTSNTKGSASGITANDFLTLLVTEMKNQDPTANTDPNQYINQLVNVNSLQQLISINETLTSAYGSSNANVITQPSTRANTANSVAANAKATSQSPSQPSSAVTSSSNLSSAGESTLQASFNKLAHGNLSAPAANPAAERLAHALDGHSSAPISKY